MAFTSIFKPAFVPVIMAMTMVLGGTFLQRMSTSWIRLTRTPDIRAWNQRVMGKNHKRMNKPTIPMAIHINVIPTLDIIFSFSCFLQETQIYSIPRYRPPLLGSWPGSGPGKSVLLWLHHQTGRYRRDSVG